MRRVREVRIVAIAAFVTIAAWVYTIHSAGSMASAMPMPGGWSMSMAWMSMGGQSSMGHAVMFVTMWTVIAMCWGLMAIQLASGS